MSLDCDNYYEDCPEPTAQTLQVDAQGNSYALVAFNGTTQDSLYANYYYVYKYDAAGKLIKEIYLGANAWDFSDSGAQHKDAIDMAVDGNGNIYTALEDFTFNDDGSSAYTNLISKYLPSGSLQWRRTSTAGVPYGVTVSKSGSVYVVGTTGLARYTNDGNLTWTVKADNSRGVLENAGNVVVSGSNLYTRYRKDIRKYDGTGKQVWLKSQSGLSTMVFQDMTGDGSGNVYLSGKYDAGGGNFNAMTRKLNSSGTVLWTKTYGTLAYDDARGIATISGSEAYVTGETQGSLAHTNRGGRDGYLRKLNSGGNPVWTR